MDGINPKNFILIADLEEDFVEGISSTQTCQEIAINARAQGYTVIKFRSYRAEGVNYVIFSDFENILSPRIVTPVQ